MLLERITSSRLQTMKHVNTPSSNHYDITVEKKFFNSMAKMKKDFSVFLNRRIYNVLRNNSSANDAATLV